jgi:hypothetical protein
LWVKPKSWGVLKKGLTLQKNIDLDTTLLSLLLPEGILEYFELTNVVKKEDS